MMNVENPNEHVENPNELQTMVNRVVEANKHLGMKVNLKKTKIQYMGKAQEDF